MKLKVERVLPPPPGGVAQLFMWQASSLVLIIRHGFPQSVIKRDISNEGKWRDIRNTAFWLCPLSAGQNPSETEGDMTHQVGHKEGLPGDCYTVSIFCVTVNLMFAINYGNILVHRTPGIPSSRPAQHATFSSSLLKL